MKFVLMLCSDITVPAQLMDEAVLAGCGGWTEDLDRQGRLHAAASLRPAAEATTVKVRDGEVLLTDGPFAETKDQIGGLSLIEAADLDEALELAAKHPWATVGQIEVRPAP
jgi:hypothetical protein